jgi:hypothetical protein
LPHPSVEKLVNVLGQERAVQLVSETMSRAGVISLDTPTERYRFACDLMKQGGLLEAIGRALKIQAILHGAKEM